MRLHVGTSGYNFDEWKGTFYPEKLPADQWLRYYAERLPAVEINYTFYRMPNAKTIGQWLETTPDGFTFVRSEEHTSELQSRLHLVCRLLLEKKKKKNNTSHAV